MVLAGSSAYAAPKGAAAKKLFDKGVAAYTKGDFPTAAASLAESYTKEKDVETLFAWAQAERKQGHCSNAVELYNELLVADLPDENKQVIQGQLAECKEILAKEKPASDSRPPTSDSRPPTSDSRPPTSGAETEKPVEPVAQSEPPPPKPEVGSPKSEVGHPWWKDPVGGGLVVGGVVAIGVGTVMLVSASSANSDRSTAGSYSAYQNDTNTAHDRGTYGVIGLTVGGALVVGGIIRYATHKSDDHAAVTGFVTPTGGGLAAFGRF